MTPYEIKLFLIIAFTQEPLNECPILKDTLERFVRDGMIKVHHSSVSGYKIGTTGEVYMSLIKKIVPSNIHV